MGLDCSHGAFSGAYSAFNRFRQAVCAAAGGSYPPHWLYDEKGEFVRTENGFIVIDRSKDSDTWYIDDKYSPETHPGLWEFFSHSDCDGEIASEVCAKLAEEMEALLPAIEALNWEANGHIARDGGFIAVTERFIAGCWAAAAEGKPLEFH